MERLKVDSAKSRLPMTFPYYLKQARDAEKRACQAEAQQANQREAAKRAGERPDQRIMQMGRLISEARRERDRWIDLASAMAAAHFPPAISAKSRK